VYYATKAFVLHFSEALDEELRDTAVRVSAFCPGPTATGFKSRAQLEESKLFNQPQNVMDAGVVAEVGYRGLLKGQRVVIPGFWNKLLVQGSRIMPRRLVTSIVRNMQERRAPG